MPPGTPFNAFLTHYPIRVDDFTSLPESSSSPTPLLHLLTHTHSDHIAGLSAKSFGQKVVCSPDAKQILLLYEPFYERSLHDMEFRAEKNRVFAHLKVDPPAGPLKGGFYPGTRDLLSPLPLNTPTDYELFDGCTVRITAIDANHCPGAVMYLVEGNKGAVLHTGDFRAEPSFIDSVKRNPFLQPYLAPRYAGTAAHDQRRFTKRLEAIHLDTACVLGTSEVPTKESAVDGLIDLMKLYPSSVYFFINTWAWGYEDILKAISREFDSPIHFDRYKTGVFLSLKNEPHLKSLIAGKSVKTHFHACERFCRCDDVSVNDEPAGQPRKTHSVTGNRVIYINPVNMTPTRWSEYVVDTKVMLGRDYRKVTSLLVPLSRHSPLPELKRFVSLFKPKRMIPNTLIPGLHGLDWKAMDQMFADCVLDPSSHLAKSSTSSSTENLAGFADTVDDDVALKNLIGGAEIEDVAKKWAENGKMRSKLMVVRTFLDPHERQILDGMLGIRPSVPKVQPSTTTAKKRRTKEIMELSSSPVHPTSSSPHIYHPPQRIVGRGLPLILQESQETDFSSHVGDDEDEWWKEKTMRVAMGYTSSSVSGGKENEAPGIDDEDGMDTEMEAPPFPLRQPSRSPVPPIPIRQSSRVPVPPIPLRQTFWPFLPSIQTLSPSSPPRPSLLLTPDLSAPSRRVEQWRVAVPKLKPPTVPFESQDPDIVLLSPPPIVAKKRRAGSISLTSKEASDRPEKRRKLSRRVEPRSSSPPMPVSEQAGEEDLVQTFLLGPSSSFSKFKAKAKANGAEVTDLETKTMGFSIAEKILRGQQMEAERKGGASGGGVEDKGFEVDMEGYVEKRDKHLKLLKKRRDEGLEG